MARFIRNKKAKGTAAENELVSKPGRITGFVFVLQVQAQHSFQRQTFLQAEATDES